MRLRHLLPFLLLFPVGLILGQNTTEPAPVGAPVEVYYGRPLIRSFDKLLADLGVELFPEDIVRVFPDPWFGLGSKITVIRATPLLINDGGKKFVVRTFKRTIGEVLDEKGIVLGAQDRIDPPLNAGVLPDGTVNITRVEETEVVEKREIPFKTNTQLDANIYACSSVTAQEGRSGSKKVIYHVRRENGVEVSRRFVSEKITAEPVDKIVKNGTKIPPVLEAGAATWYDWMPGSAAHKTLPFGTKVLVRSVSTGKTTCVTINDRGPRNPARVIDLHRANFQALAPLGAGIIQVTLHVIP